MIEKFVNDLGHDVYTYTETLIPEIVKDKEDNIVRLIIKAVNSIGMEMEYAVDLERAKRALVKEFSPVRMMTLEELRGIREPTLVWVQDSDKYVAIRPEEFYGIEKLPQYSGAETVEFANGFDYTFDYGRTYIFWTAKPTKEQQAKVVWLTAKREESSE